MPATWATVDDVFDITGADVNDAGLAQAGSTIDMASARIYEMDASRIGARDLYWLKLACCYQAAWLASQFDFFRRVDRYTDGHSSTLTTYPEGAFAVSLNAKIALKRVSWLKSRSLHVQSSFQDGPGFGSIDPLSSANDGMYDWTNLEG